MPDRGTSTGLLVPWFAARPSPLSFRGLVSRRFREVAPGVPPKPNGTCQ